MERKKRRRWTEGDIDKEVRAAAMLFGGRMPSAPELQGAGNNALAAQISRSPGGYRAVAKRLGLSLKDSCTAFGQDWEAYVDTVLKNVGRESVRQTTRAPFDLLVDGKVRVNVKSARWHKYGPCKGFFFGIAQTWKHCDVFALVKVDGPTPAILWVPSSEAQQQTITLTGKHRLNTFTSMDVLDSF